MHSLPEPCVVFRVSVSPNCPLIEAGEVYLALNTLVGPISSLQWRMASSRARTYALIGPLRPCINKKKKTSKNWYKSATTCSNRRWNVFITETDGCSNILQSGEGAQKLFWDASWEFSDWLPQGCFSKHIITEIIKPLLWQCRQWFTGGTEWKRRCLMCCFSLAVRGAMRTDFVSCQRKSRWRWCGALPWHEFNKSLVEESAWDVKENKVK